MQPTEPALVPRRHLAPNAQLLFFLNYLGKTIIVLILAGATLFVEPLISAAILAAYFLLPFLISILAYQHFSFEINENGFEKEYGIFHRYHVGIPFQQIQNVNINRSIIDRMLGIAQINIETAGSSRVEKREIIGGISTKAEGILPGINVRDARYIHDLLLQKAREVQSGSPASAPSAHVSAPQQ